jgi:hypothetical protein
MSTLNMKPINKWHKINEWLERVDDKILIDWIGYFNNTLDKSTQKKMVEPIANMCHKIAKYFVEIYGEKFVCASIEHQTMYEYKNHKWNKMDGYNSIRELLSGKFSDILSDELQDLYHQYHTTKSIREQNTLNQEIDEIKNIIVKLKCTPIINAIIRELADLLYDSTF